MARADSHNIGRWVQRQRRSGEQKGKAHLVQSLIMDRYVMKCGKEMKVVAYRTGTLIVVEKSGSFICSDCDARS